MINNKYVLMKSEYLEENLGSDDNFLKFIAEMTNDYEYGELVYEELKERFDKEIKDNIKYLKLVQVVFKDIKWDD